MRRATSRAARTAIRRATSSGSASQWDEGPVRQSERQDVYREAADRLGSDRFGGITLLREDGTADVPAGQRRRRHRVRDHARHPRERPPAERAAPPRPDTRARRASRRSTSTIGLILGEDGRKLSKREFGRDGCVAAGRRHSRPGRPPLPRRARPAEARRALRPAAHPPARDRGDRGDERRRAGRRSRRADRGRPGAPRRARPRTRPRTTPGRCSSPSLSSLGEEARPTLERFKELRTANGEPTAKDARPRAEGGRRRPDARCGSR